MPKPQKKSITEEKKLFTISEITIGTFLTGPFTAILGIYHNYKTLGDLTIAKKFLLLASLISFTTLSIPTFLPEQTLEKIPHMLWVVFFTGAAWIYFYKIHTKKILEKFPNKKFPKKSVGKTIILMLQGLAIVGIIFFFLGFAQGLVESMQ